MKEEIKQRVIKEANQMIKTNQTIREIAKTQNISKSTVHKDLKERLKTLNKDLDKKVKKIIEKHTETRHIKGGESTKKKYQKEVKNI